MVRKAGRRRKSTINMMSPVLRAAVRAGDKISVYSPDGDPRSTQTNLKHAIGVPLPFRLEPLYFHDFFNVSPLSAEEIAQLEQKLGHKTSADFFEKIHLALIHYISTVALDNRFPKWVDIKIRLKLAIKSGEDLLRAANEFSYLTGMDVKHLDRQRGVLDLDQLMRICMSMNQPVSQISVDITHVVRLLKQELIAVEAEAHRPGKKPDRIIVYFLRDVFLTALREGINVELPSNNSKDGSSSQYEFKISPFFAFVQHLMLIIFNKAENAIAGSKLSVEEKSEAMKKLKQKSYGSLLDYARKARKSVDDADHNQGM